MASCSDDSVCGHLRVDAVERPRHGDQLRHFLDRIDVGAFDKPLNDAVLREVENRRRRLVGNDAGILGARQLGVVVDREETDRADLLAVLSDHAVAGNRRRAGRRIEQDRRAARVENGVAVQRLEGAGLGNAHAAVARVGDAVGGVDRKPALALHGDVERIAGLDHGAGLSGYERRSAGET